MKRWVLLLSVIMLALQACGGGAATSTVELTEAAPEALTELAALPTTEAPTDLRSSKPLIWSNHS
jgi:hypothetical protein